MFVKGNGGFFFSPNHKKNLALSSCKQKGKLKAFLWIPKYLYTVSYKYLYNLLLDQLMQQDN